MSDNEDQHALAAAYLNPIVKEAGDVQIQIGPDPASLVESETPSASSGADTLSAFGPGTSSVRTRSPVDPPAETEPIETVETVSTMSPEGEVSTHSLPRLAIEPPEPVPCYRKKRNLVFVGCIAVVVGIIVVTLLLSPDSDTRSRFRVGDVKETTTQVATTVKTLVEEMMNETAEE